MTFKRNLSDWATFEPRKIDISSVWTFPDGNFHLWWVSDFVILSPLLIHPIFFSDNLITWPGDARTLDLARYFTFSFGSPVYAFLFTHRNSTSNFNLDRSIKVSPVERKSQRETITQYKGHRTSGCRMLCQMWHSPRAPPPPDDCVWNAQFSNSFCVDFIR